MGRLVHIGLGSQSLVAHVLQFPHPPFLLNSCVIGTAVINTQKRGGKGGRKGRGNAGRIARGKGRERARGGGEDAKEEREREEEKEEEEGSRE